jgi:hypothetical protein
MIDAIQVTGTSELVAVTVTAYRQAGVDVPVIFPLTWGQHRTTKPALSTPPCGPPHPARPPQALRTASHAP